MQHSLIAFDCAQFLSGHKKSYHIKKNQLRTILVLIFKHKRNQQFIAITTATVTDITGHKTIKIIHNEQFWNVIFENM